MSWKWVVLCEVVNLCGCDQGYSILRKENTRAYIN